MFRQLARQVGMLTVARAAPTVHVSPERLLRHRPHVARQFVHTSTFKHRRCRERGHVVAMASPGLTLLVPFFFLAPFAMFFGPLGCLPLVFAAPFLFAFWALSAALTLATFIVTSVIALAGATAVAYFVLPRALGKSPSELQTEFEETINKRFRQGPVIDIQKNPSVDDVYDDLDKDLDDFDKTLRDRRRR